MESKKDIPDYNDICSNVDPSNTGARRALMVALFKHLGVYSEEKWAETKAVVVESFCDGLYKQGVKKASVTFFEFYIDQGIWHAWFKGKSSAPQWPWKNYKSKAADCTGGASLAYAE